MKRSLSLCLTTAVLTLATAASTAWAQTGSSGPAPGPVTLPNAPPPDAMLPTRVAELLRRDGHPAEIKTLPNGSKMVTATIQRDGWRYAVEFEYNAAGTNVNVICPLGNAASKFAPAQLLALLQKSYELPCPIHFSYRAADQRLCLEDPCYSPAKLTDALVRDILTRLLKHIRDTHPLWDSNPWPAGAAQPAAAAGTTGPVAPVAPGAPAGAVIAAPGLAQTTWIGHETLAGYGRLEFRFGAAGTVTMIDKDGATPGTYTQDGNTVVLRFYENTVVYTGMLNGPGLSGTAQNGKDTWDFSVNR